MKQQKQEEKASQKASREAARVLLKLEKERLRTGKDVSSRGPSIDRSVSRPLIMRRHASILLRYSLLGRQTAHWLHCGRPKNFL